MMYLSHFGLSLQPFQINTDQRFLYLSEKHQEALAILRYGILDNRGILVLTGDVGTGKTILVHALLQSLGPEVRTAVIADPSLKGLDFFNFLAHAFGMKNNFKTKGQFLIQLGNFLDRQFKADRRVLLVIDEAQNIDPDQLEKIRILSDLERDNNQRINVFFVGQSEFNVKLADSRLRALKQRITSHYHIEPLSLKETVHTCGIV
jgi:general secretion pathway protein A